MASAVKKCGIFSSLGVCGRPKWWQFDSNVICCIVLLSILMFPKCLAEEEHSNEHGVYYYLAQINITFTDPKTNNVKHESYPGKYGVKSLVEQQSGVAVHVRTKDNKTDGCTEYNVKLPSEKWIAVVERGDCLFTDKIKLATKTYNASGVVIYNNDEQTTIMQHTVSDQVSVLVSKESGKQLTELIDSGVRVMMTIIPGQKDFSSSDHASNSISKTSVLFVSISFIVLMIISLAWLVFYYIQRFRYAHAKERLARRLASAAKKAISKIPQKTVRHGDRELDSEFDQCAVCIESYKTHDVVRTLPCKHVFHKSCVDPWLLDQRSCPMCKLDILRAYGMQIFGSHESIQQGTEGGTVTVQMEEQEHTTVTDDQPANDTEVKVLLLPYPSVVYQAAQDAGPSGSSTRGSSSGHEEGQEHHILAPGGVKRNPNVNQVNISAHGPPHGTQFTEMQALMCLDQEEEEEEEGDSKKPCFQPGALDLNYVKELEVLEMDKIPINKEPKM